MVVVCTHAARLRSRLATLALAFSCALTGSGAAGASVTLEVGYIPIVPMAQLYIITGESWTWEFGLELRPHRYSSGPEIVKALRAGKLDVVYMGVAPAMVARARGIDIKVVAANVVEQVAMISLGRLARLSRWLPARTAFDRFRAMTGRAPRVATLHAGSVPYTMLNYWLRHSVGADPASIEILGMGAGEVRKALVAGSVDGAVIVEPILTIAEARHPEAHIMAYGGDMLPGQPGAILAVRRRLISAHPEAVRGLVRLHVRATQQLRRAHERAALHIHSAIGGPNLDFQTVLRALRGSRNKFVADPRTIRGATQRMRDFQGASGELKGRVPIDSLFDTSFYKAVVGGI